MTASAAAATEEGASVRRLFLQPGSVCLPGDPAHICAVVGSGVVVTLFDQDLQRGGMAYFVRPVAATPDRWTALVARPCIGMLFRLFKELGSRRESLEIAMYGASQSPQTDPRHREVARANIRAGREILAEFGFQPDIQDVGGRRGRRIAFHSATGETVVALTHRIRRSDWL